MDLASVKGVAAEPVIERPKIPVLQTRAALVILLITMVSPSFSKLMVARDYMFRKDR